MFHYKRRTLGKARIKEHAINPEQLKNLNLILCAGFLCLTALAFINTLL